MFKRKFEAFNHKVWLASPTMHGEELKYVTEAYETNWMSTVGKNINEVEKIAAEKAEVNYAVGLSTCTAALHLCVKLAGERLYGKPATEEGRKPAQPYLPSWPDVIRRCWILLIRSWIS